ncbi:hypothetical protein GRF29_216g21473 [Pseudopithomyces chartarum]|uniref:FAD-binding PCMH-type domain-containing protein n=1 Tax=Pseudopithomyces chartarum TaxID=1892770 RepID=A0AAN6LN96_9PLEO|nr:hypothetical protein GRF29_216g21473 [Pseudopithomyces chartarum]
MGFGVVGQRHFGGGIGGDTVQVVLSYFSYAHGFVGDNVTNYEVALASGEIVKAKSSTNKDLWSALKGGGNSFGIVTRYDLAIFPQGDMCYLKRLADDGISGAAANRVAKLSTTVKADTRILKLGMQTYRSSFERIKDVANILFFITFDLIPAQLISQSIARGGNATGLTPLDGPIVVILFYVSYDKPADD